MQGARQPEERGVLCAYVERRGWKGTQQMAVLRARIRSAGRPGKVRTRHDRAPFRDAPPVTSLLTGEVGGQAIHHPRRKQGNHQDVENVDRRGRKQIQTVIPPKEGDERDPPEYQRGGLGQQEETEPRQGHGSREKEEGRPRHEEQEHPGIVLPFHVSSLAVDRRGHGRFFHTTEDLVVSRGVRALRARYDPCMKTGVLNEKCIPVFNALW